MYLEGCPNDEGDVPEGEGYQNRAFGLFNVQISRTFINPNRIRVKYSLILWGDDHVAVLIGQMSNSNVNLRHLS